MKLLLPLLVIFSLLMIGCKKNEEVTEPIPEYFNGTFQATINDIPTSPTWYNIYQGFTLYENINGTDSSGFDFRSGFSGFNDKNSIDIHLFYHFPNGILIHTINGQLLSAETFHRLFDIGSYSYTYIAILKGGVIVTWYDDQAIKWTSGKINITDSLPIVKPTYSNDNFTIKYSISESSGYQYRHRIQAAFNCWVYNAYGDSTHIENAKFNGIFSY